MNDRFVCYGNFKEGCSRCVCDCPDKTLCAAETMTSASEKNSSPIMDNIKNERRDVQ